MLDLKYTHKSKKAPVKMLRLSADRESAIHIKIIYYFVYQCQGEVLTILKALASLPIKGGQMGSQISGQIGGQMSNSMVAQWWLNLFNR